MNPLRFLIPGLLVVSGSVLGQGYRSQEVELANLREDVKLLKQQLGEYQLRLEQLERDNRELIARSGQQRDSFATLVQLNEAVANLNQAIKASASATKAETLQQVSVQLEKLARQTNAALDAMSRPAASPVAPASFSDDFPKEGIKYTVAKGDSVGSIARKTGAKVADIINANRLSDPSKITVGQVLFVPGGK